MIGGFNDDEVPLFAKVILTSISFALSVVCCMAAVGFWQRSSFPEEQVLSIFLGFLGLISFALGVMCVFKIWDERKKPPST